MHNNVQERKPNESEKKSSGRKVPRSKNFPFFFLHASFLPNTFTFSKRNVKLLSFGADEDAGEDEETVVFEKKSIVRPDCTFQRPIPPFHELFFDIDFEQWWKTQEQ